jgi:uncharacterized protein YegP (UPF0339 family)
VKFLIYRDALKEFRWRLVARNGRVVAEGGEGYKKRQSVYRQLRKIFCSYDFSARIEKAIEEHEQESA